MRKSLSNARTTQRRTTGGLRSPFSRIADLAMLHSTFREQDACALGPPALRQPAFLALEREAGLMRSQAWHVGGRSDVQQSNWRASLGSAALSFLESDSTTRLLESVTGTTLAFSPEASCYTYYDEVGDYCGVHRDRSESCTVTLILCLAASTAPGTARSPGMELFVFGKRFPTDEPRLRVSSRPNRIVIMRGCETFHGRPQLGDGERVVLLTACFHPVK